MVNIEALKGIIEDSGLTIPKIAERAGLEYRVLYNRLQGLNDFKISEVEKLQEVLKFSDRDRNRIFFAKEVDTHSNDR